METNCIFCKISNSEIPSKKVYEDSVHIAFLDINPFSKGHTLVIPKKHYETFLEMPQTEYSELFKIVQKVSAKLKTALNAKLIFLLVMGEEVPHTHVHLIPYYGGELPFERKKHDETPFDDVLKEIENAEI